MEFVATLCRQRFDRDTRDVCNQGEVWGRQSCLRSIGPQRKPREGRRAVALPELWGHAASASDGALRGTFGEPRGPQCACHSPSARNRVPSASGAGVRAAPPRMVVAQSPAQVPFAPGERPHVRQPGRFRCATMPPGARFVSSVARPLCLTLANPPGSTGSCSAFGPGP